MDRSKRIVRTSIIGIVVNVVLVLFKAAVGLVTNSIAVLLDAVNNLSDALSSVITIVGTKLAGKRPDRKHPYGHGRVEYLASVLVSLIVLFAGATALWESVQKVISPEETSYSAVSLVLIGVGVVVKFFCGRYVKKVGKEVQSGALIAAGSDAFFDSILSFGTFVAAAVNMIWGFSLEGMIGAAISVIILKAGIGMLTETLSSIIGTRADKELTDQLKATVLSYPQVRGVYDLILHNYGPVRSIGSLHIEVSDQTTAREIHYLTRQISADVYQKFGIILTIGIYASGDSSQLLAEIRACLENLISERNDILQMHGFYGDEETKTVTFDLIVDFRFDAVAAQDSVVDALKQKFPDYRFDVVLDSDFSD